METGSRDGLGPISASASAAEEMPEQQHTQAEQDLIEVEKLNDEAKFQEVFRKTFITEQKKTAESGELWALADMQIPLGQPAKLIKIFEPNNEDFRITEVANRLKFVQPTPVILLAGAYKARGKTMAGIARAAYNTRSIVLDSGMGSEIEKFTMRKGTQLLGVCPDAQVSFPKISNRQPNELTNGHTHFFLIGREESTVDALEWGQESRIKYDLA